MVKNKFRTFVKVHYPKLLSVGFFALLFSAYIYAFANPPVSPYQGGVTLDPTCAPGDTNCFVQIIPDQTGNNGKYLTTDGSVTSWTTITPFVLTNGSGTTANGSAVDLGGTTTGSTLINASGGSFEISTGTVGLLLYPSPHGTYYHSTVLGDFNVNGNGTLLRILDDANTVYFTNTNSDVMFGINTNAPSVALDVFGSISSSGIIKVDSGNVSDIYIKDDLNMGRVGLFAYTGSDLVLASTDLTKFYYGDNNLVVDGSNGRVGIGTTVPQTQLDINGSTTFRGNIIAGTDNIYDIGTSGATRPRTGYFGTSVNAPLIQMGGTTASFPEIKRNGTAINFRLADDSADAPITAGQLTAPLLIGGTGVTSTLVYKTTTGVGTTGADHIFQVGNNGATEAMRIFNSGDVSIGTASDNSYKLDVNGGIRAAGLGRFQTGGMFYGNASPDAGVGGQLLIYTSSTTSLIHAYNGASYSGLGFRGSSFSYYTGQGSYGQMTLSNAGTLTLNDSNTNTANVTLNNLDAATYKVDATGTSRFATAVQTPLIIGGTTTTSPLTLRSTSGVGTTGADIIFQTGSNGGTEAMRILNSGNVGIGTATPNAPFEVHANSGSNTNWYLSDDDVSHGITAIAPTNVVGKFGTLHSTDGGLAIIGMSDGAGTTGALIEGTIGVADPTDSVPAVYIRGDRASGTTRAALGNLETVFQLNNFTTPLLTALGSGNIGIGTASPAGVLSLAGSRTASAWGTSGINFQTAAATYTDSSSSGTVANVVANSFGIPTLTASSATTYTNASTLYIAGAPTAGTNVSLTSPYALDVNGTSRFQSAATFPAGLIYYGPDSGATTTKLRIIQKTGWAVYPGIEIGAVNTDTSAFSGTPTIIGGRNVYPDGSHIIVGATNNLSAGTSATIVGTSNTVTSGSSQYIFGNSNIVDQYTNGQVGGIVIGGFNNTNGFYGGGLIGSSLKYYANHQLAFGGNSNSVDFGITDIFFGYGVQNENTSVNSNNGNGPNISINPSWAANATDKNGGNITIAGGRGTGAGTPGNIIFSTSSILASGSTLQSLTAKMTILSGGNVGIGTTSPGAKLQVGDYATNTSNEIAIATLNTGINGFYIRAGSSSGNIRAAIQTDYTNHTALFIGGYNNGSNIIGQDTNTGDTILYSGSSNTERMKIYGAGNIVVTSPVTTGTGATAGVQILANSLTTGNGLEVSSSSLTTGNLVSFSTTSTVAASNTQTVLNVSTSGANPVNQTTYGGYFSNTHTGTNSVNTAIYATASGGSSNYAANFGATLLMSATSPCVSFQLGTCSSSDNFINRSGTQVTVQGSGAVQLAVGGTSYLDAVTSKVRLFTGGSGEVLIGTSTDAGAFSFQSVGNTYINPNVYANAVGGLTLVRTTNFSGVAAETALDLSVKPSLTLTEPGSGTFTWNSGDIDMSSIAVTAGAGTTVLNALRLAGVSDADAGTVRGLFVDNLSATAAKEEAIHTGTGWDYAAIFEAGNVGIQNTAPGFALHVGSSATTDSTTLIRLEDANSTCDFNANAGGPTCGSDLTLKKDITSLDNADLLNRVSQLNPVSYHWLTDSSSSDLQYGFIAQEVATQFPELVTDHTWIDGSTKKFLNMNGLIPYLAGSIKELDIQVKDLSSLDITNSNSLGSLIKQFLADVGNGIENLFVKKIHTEELCVKKSDGTEVCVTGDQLDHLINGATPTSGGGGGTPPPPVTDVCPNIDGDQVSIPDGMHLDTTNNCVADDTPPTDTGGSNTGDTGAGTPPAEQPPQGDTPQP